MEELEVGNDHVNRAVGKGAPLLDPGGIRADGVIRQVPFVKHLKKDSKIIQGKILLKSNDSGSKQTAR